MCLFAKRWVIVVFSTNFYPTQSGRHTLVQCWPNVMHPTQLSHVKTSHRCTLARRWINVVFSTNCHPKSKWHAYFGPMLAQRNAPNATRSYQNKSLVYIGPTLGQRSIFNKLLSKTKVADIRWSNAGPT